jgi:hypothetical protein
MKIKEIIIENGFINLCPVTNETIAGINTELRNRVQWVSYREMRIENNYDGRDYWCQMKDLSIAIVADIGTIRVRIKPGWITDLGSVPLWARGLIGHTNPKWILAFLIHDACFSTNALSFEMSNDLLFAIGRHNKASWFQRFSIETAMKTSKAKSAYEKSDASLAYEREWASLRWDPK